LLSLNPNLSPKPPLPPSLPPSLIRSLPHSLAHSLTASLSSVPHPIPSLSLSRSLLFSPLPQPPSLYLPLLPDFFPTSCVCLSASERERRREGGGREGGREGGGKREREGGRERERGHTCRVLPMIGCAHLSIRTPSVYREHILSIERTHLSGVADYKDALILLEELGLLTQILKS